MKLVAKQVYESPRHNFLSMCPRLNLIWLFIFVGETGADCWDTLHKCAYSLCGKPVRSKKLIFRGEHLSTLGAMSTSGVLDSEVVRSAVDADDFYDFIHSSLLPNSCLLMGLVPIVSSSWIIVQLIKCKKLLLPLSWSTCTIPSSSFTRSYATYWGTILFFRSSIKHEGIRGWTSNWPWKHLH